MGSDILRIEQLDTYYKLIRLRAALDADMEYCLICLKPNCVTHTYPPIDYNTTMEVSQHLMQVAEMELRGGYYTIQENTILPRIDLAGKYDPTMKYIAMPISTMPIGVIHITYADTWFVHGAAPAKLIPKPNGIGLGTYYGFCDAELEDFNFICMFKNYE